MKDAIIQILMGYLGSLGFNILFNIRGRKLFIASLGGLISWTVFLLLEPVLPGEPIRFFLAAAAVTVYGEVFARIEKTPTTTFLVPSIIPLIPGGSLYYTMNFALNKQWAEFSARGFYTLQLALALAVGIIFVTTLVRLLTLARKKLRNAEFFQPFPLTNVMSLLRSKNFTWHKPNFTFAKQKLHLAQAKLHLRSLFMKNSELRNRSKAFSLQIIAVCDSVDTKKGRSVLVNQIVRSGTSIGANVHEASYASSRADFINKLHIAAKECIETEYWIEMLEGAGAVSGETAQELMRECGIIRRMLAKSIMTVKANMES